MRGGSLAVILARAILLLGVLFASTGGGLPGPTRAFASASAAPSSPDASASRAGVESRGTATGSDFPGRGTGPGVIAQEASPTAPAGPTTIEPQPFPRRMAYAAAALVVGVLALGGALILWRMGPGPDGEDGD